MNHLQIFDKEQPNTTSWIISKYLTRVSVAIAVTK